MPQQKVAGNMQVILFKPDVAKIIMGRIMTKIQRVESRETGVSKLNITWFLFGCNDQKLLSLY